MPKVFLFHSSCAEGNVFDSNDVDAMINAGWVDSPALINQSSALHVTNNSERKTEHKALNAMIGAIEKKGYKVTNVCEQKINTIVAVDLATVTTEKLLSELKSRNALEPVPVLLDISSFNDRELFAEINHRELITDSFLISEIKKRNIKIDEPVAVADETHPDENKEVAVPDADNEKNYEILKLIETFKFDPSSLKAKQRKQIAEHLGIDHSKLNKERLIKAIDEAIGTE